MSRRQDMTQAEAEEVLGLPEAYGRDDLRKAFTTLARRYHPDNARANGLTAEEAQRRMVEVNRANGVLKRFFDTDPDAVIHRDLASGNAPAGAVGVHFDPMGQRARQTAVDDALFWDEDGNARGTVQEDRATMAADAPGHRLRRVLLGPVIFRVALCLWLAWTWWKTFPFLPANSAAYGLDDPAATVDWLRVACMTVYPTYFLVYELFSGTISSTIRELLNGLASLVTKTHVEVRPKGAYRSSLSALIANQWYGALMLPLALWLAQVARGQEGTAMWIWWALCALVAIDALLAFFGTGLVNSLMERLADWVEKRYVEARMSLLKRCGQWASSAPAASAAASAGARPSASASSSRPASRGQQRPAGDARAAQAARPSQGRASAAASSAYDGSAQTRPGTRSQAPRAGKHFKGGSAR